MAIGLILGLFGIVMIEAYRMRQWGLLLGMSLVAVICLVLYEVAG